MQIISAILEETINQSKLDITKGVIRNNSKDDFILRPSTPFKFPNVF